jgi:hypothetical protein
MWRFPSSIGRWFVAFYSEGGRGDSGSLMLFGGFGGSEQNNEKYLLESFKRSHDHLHDISSLHNYRDLAVRRVIRESFGNLFSLARFVSSRNHSAELYQA